MGKNNIIKKFQTARLDEWIGDYKSADIIYEEIQKSDDKLSYILKPTVKERKRKLPITEERFDKIDDFGIDYLLDDNILMVDTPAQKHVYYKKTKVEKVVENDIFLYRPDSLKPHDEHVKIQNVQIKWKYSISVVSKVDKYLRLEIRGYNAEGSTPKLNTEIPKKINDWNIDCIVESFNKVDTLLEINAFYEEGTKMYLNIDRWGLLSGSIIVDEEYLGDTLISIHIFLDNLSNKLW